MELLKNAVEKTTLILADYHDFAKAAYKNCIEILDEANLLLDHQAYPRAYALGVLSAEEFAKAFLAKAYAAGVVNDKRFLDDIMDHRIKQIHFVSIISTAMLLTKHGKGLLDELSEARQDPQTANQKIQNALDQMFNDTTDFDTISDLFSSAELLKQDGFYVRMVGDVLTTPSEKITPTLAKDAIRFLSSTLYHNENMFELSAADFKDLVMLLDPVLLSGKVLTDDYRKQLGELKQEIRKRQRAAHNVKHVLLHPHEHVTTQGETPKTDTSSK